jgi:PAS domain S-box-containing protein
MHEREEQYHLLLDTSPDAILIFDEHDTISELNSQAAHLLGYTTDQLKGQPLSRIASGLNLHASSYTAQQHRPAIDHRFIHRDGSIVPVEISVAAFSQHQQRFFICAARDTTERNALKEQLLEHQQQLESKIAQRSRELAEAIETLTQRNADLERMNKLFIGREFRIKELKDTIQRLTAAADDARQ